MPAADLDVVDLNLLWLIKARELAESDPDKAVIVLGLDADLVSELSTLSLGELASIASSGVLQFRPRFREALWQHILERRGSASISVRLQTLLMAASLG
ncbi:MAG: flagellar transcriptional regulator FlhD [Gammaproteobacteria bacterium]|nr:flagellar transcriptional regulator FlhD [Gammaproteobacteria bacterium]